MFDVSSFTSDRANVPTDVIVKHPITNEVTELVISVVGSDSTKAQECVDRQQARRFRAMTKGEDIVAPEFDPKEAREDQLELLVACTVGWKNMVYGGKEMEFTPENAKLVYDSAPFIREQIAKATGNRARFFKS